MQPAAGPSGTAPRGGSRGRGSLSKFKPKNIRRSASELKAVADAEDKRAAAAAAIAGRSRGRDYASRGRGGRGRGDAMGRGRATMGGGVASGPFAVAPEIGEFNIPW
jgi:DNA-directed RNA polymerase III subunit RPC4